MMPKCTIHLTADDIMKIIKSHFNLEANALFRFYGLPKSVQTGDVPVEVLGITAEVKTDFPIKPVGPITREVKTE